MYDFGDARSAGKTSGNALELYVPVLDYLSQSPINFGQIAANTLPSHPPLFQSPTPLSPSSLPASIPLLSSPVPPSPSVPLPFPLSHGTTTLAFAFQGGAIAAADTRSSCGGLVACPASHKVLPVHSHMVGTTSGTSADCALWKRILARECRLYHLRNHRRLSVGGAAKLLAYMLHPFKGTEVCVALTLCGWDEGRGGASPPVEDMWVMEEKVAGWGGEEGCGSKGRKETRECAGQACEREREGEAAGEGRTESDEERTALGQEASEAEEELGAKAERMESEREEDTTHSGCVEDVSLSRASAWAGGPRLYYVCSDGTCLQGELFSVGSGSPYAYSVLDCGLQWGLSLSEAVSLAREAVYRATHRDAYSGNCVDVFYINSQGWRCREREDLREEYYREREKRKMRQGEQEKCRLKDK